MKKMLITILIICCVICLYSCANESVNNPQDSIMNNNELTANETGDIFETEDHDIGDIDMGDTSSEIGGSHMGDELYSPYNGYVDTIVYKKGTFSENYAQYMTKFDEMEGKWNNNRPALMYYLVCEMNLTRNDLETYYTALGYENETYDEFKKFWPADVHVMAKEIIRFHSLIWPAMLMALDLPLPKKIVGHGWITFGGGKMSKSSGNVVDPFILTDRYGVDALRYHLLREMPFGADAPYTNEMMFNRINCDLANDLGNLVSRTVAMVIKYFGGKLPVEREADSLDDELFSMLDNLPSKVIADYETLHIADGLEAIFKVIARANKYIDENAPWVLANDADKKVRLATVLYNLLDTVRRCTILLSPVMPNTAPAIYEQIGACECCTTLESASVKGALKADVEVKKGPVLFPRIDVEKELAELEALNPKKEEAEPEIPLEPLKENCVFDDFLKLDIRAGKILSCEKVKKSDKLLCFQIDDGFGGRQILSGIAKYYEPEQLVGKTIAMIVNFPPRKMMGLESNGMILSVRDGDKFRVVEFGDDIKPGADIG